ncbi:MAG: CHAT domain-containing protein [Ignavibacteriae bacterium]|nr:CHAT domain-containing protein [Ignavibacteriota bacterium]NOH00088.1 CHAT domain-containing protein [Ignavibacteriota bacterium]
MARYFVKIFYAILIVSLFYSSPAAKSNFINIDSLKIEITNNGFKGSSLDDYIFYIVNNPIDTDAETIFLNKTDHQSNEHKLAKIFLLKKEDKFNQAYDLAEELLNSGFKNYSFYEELIFIAQADNKLERLKKRKEISSNKFLAGLIKFKEQNYSEAKKIFTELTEEDKSKENYYWRAYSERYLGNYRNALLNLNKILNTLKAEDPFYEKVLNASGSLYYLSGEYQKAEKFYREAFNKALENKNNIELVKANINLAIIDDEAGEIYEARKKLSRAQLIAEEINALDLIAIVHSELGVSYTYETRLTEAEEHYSESLNIYKSINESSRLSSLYNNLGKIYLSLFNYRLALNYFNSGLEYAGDNVRGQIMNLTQIADVYANMANYSEAFNYYQKAKALSGQIQELTLQFEIEMGLGMLDFNLGKFSESLKLFKNSKELISENKHPYLFAEAEHKIGIAYSYLDSLQLAESSFIESRKLFKKHRDIYSQLLVEYDLADLWLRTNQFKKAKNILKENREILDVYELDYLLSLNYLFNAKISIEEKKYIDAEIMLGKAIELGEKINKENIIIESIYALAKLQMLNDDKSRAEELFKSIRAKIESRSLSLIGNADVQISYFAGFDEIYNSIFNFYLEQDKPNKAFEVLDISRSRNTRQNITNLKLSASSSNMPLIKKYYELNWEVNSDLYLKAEKDSLEKDLNDIKKEILKNNPELQKYMSPIYSKTVVQIQNELDDSALVLSLESTDNVTHLFLIGKNKFKYFKQEISKEEIFKLLAQISPYYSENGITEEIIFNKDLFSFNVQKANELYNRLFKDIFELIGKNKNLIVSTSNELLNFPIESIASEYNEDSSPYSFRDTKFLVEDYNITYSPSVSIYLQLQKNKPSMAANNLLVGDPIVTENNFYINFRSSVLRNNKDINQIKLNPLEYSKEEIQSINSIVGNSINIISDEATKLNFKKYAPQSKLIHISSHSFLINELPFIVFSESNEDNGFLEIGEILQLKLDADLVVLSSCKSGLGVVDKREGILGMQKSFFDAGAKSVVVSLWDVSDKHTYLFMELFYKNLKTGLNKSYALKKAKQDFIKEYSPNPYYWAAFVLAGNTDELIFSETGLKLNAAHFILLLLVLSLIYIGKKSFTKAKKIV